MERETESTYVKHAVFNRSQQLPVDYEVVSDCAKGRSHLCFRLHLLFTTSCHESSARDPDPGMLSCIAEGSSSQDYRLPPFFLETVWNKLSSFGGAGVFLATSVQPGGLVLPALPFFAGVVSATIPLSAAFRLSMNSSANLLQSRVWLH